MIRLNTPFFYLLFISLLVYVKAHGQQRLPNVIIILADDLGYGDVSYNGQIKYNTPNIDSLAKRSLRLTQFYAGSTVCAPSRSTLLTGLHTGHTPIRGNKEIQPEGQYPLPDSLLTLAHLFKSKGYATGVFGKWGLGYPGSSGDPGNQGFDSFFGYNCQRLAHNYYPWHLWDNDQKILLEENRAEQENTYAPELIHEKALNFITQNSDRPFFLFVASPLPHAELKAPEAYIHQFRDRFEESPYEGCDPGCEDFKIGWYGSQEHPRAAFAAMVHLLDKQVGDIVHSLEKEGVLNRTMILFSSDNGPHKEGGADPEFFDSNGTYKGFKRDLYEGGIRVPTLVSWPDRIQPAKTAEVGAFWDVLPTIAEIIGYQGALPSDGRSLLPLLDGEELPVPDKLYWEFHSVYGVPAQALLLEGRWKLIRKFKHGKPGPFEVYDLLTDPEESSDLAQVRKDLIQKALATVDKERTISPISEWNFNRISDQKSKK